MEKVRLCFCQLHTSDNERLLTLLARSCYSSSKPPRIGKSKPPHSISRKTTSNCDTMCRELLNSLRAVHKLPLQHRSQLLTQLREARIDGAAENISV
jgi:hypothetical protein